MLINLKFSPFRKGNLILNTHGSLHVTRIYFSVFISVETIASESEHSEVVEILRKESDDMTVDDTTNSKDEEFGWQNESGLDWT